MARRAAIDPASLGKRSARELKREVQVSLLMKKAPPSGYAVLGAQAKSAARQAIPAAVNATNAAAQQAAPIARQAVPLAKNAGQSVKQGTDGAIAWATPYTDAARAWAAPKLEQSAIALSENLAPMISDALVTAARKIDTQPPKRQRRLGNASLLAASVLLIAAGAMTALSLRNRAKEDTGYTAMDSTGTSADSVRIIGDEPGEQAEQAEQDWIDPDANGHPGIG
jgi:hypothetical protein